MSVTTMINDDAQQSLFTCLSCSIGFLTAEEQREHYRSDHHRYNMKRRIAGLAPVSVNVFNTKVLERRQETAVTSSSRGATCEICSKHFTTENSYRSHVQSKKHKENELKQQVRKLPTPSGSQPKDEAVTLIVDDDATNEDVEKTIDQKIAAARLRMSERNCLFCPTTLLNLSENLEHMSAVHSFFIPDREYLTDLPGLVQYLGEKIAIGNVCIFCNEKGKEFRTLHAVRKHMIDKSHCKMAYGSEGEKDEVSDYYDFSSSYPDADEVPASSEEWEDLSDEESDTEDSEVSGSTDDEGPKVKNTQKSAVTYGDTPYELVLPSGARIGHRSLKRYYDQSLAPRYESSDPQSGTSLVRQMLTAKDSALIPVKGNWGAHGSGLQVMKARNKGEAREAGRHVREHRDQRRREDFKTRVGFIANHQKHFRDPLLQ